MKWFRGFLALSLMLPVVPAWAAATQTCSAAPEFSVPARKLEHFAAAARGRDEIDILAVGSGTTVGQDGGGGKAFPHRMVEALRAELPGREIHLTLRGARGTTAADMLKLIETELAEQRFSLVLWQTGTVEAVRGIPPEELSKTLDAGIARIRASGADLVLIDSPYSKTMAAKVNEAPYLQALRQAAGSSGVVLFHRYELMRSWAADGRHNLDNVPKADREKTIDSLHACLAEVLARFVSQGADIPVR